MTDESPETPQNMQNSLSQLAGTLSGSGGLPYASQQISSSDTMFDNLRYTLVSNNRQLLSQMYAEHGIIQTLIDQPVDDGFRAGFEIKTGQLTPEEIEDLEYYAEQENVIQELMLACKWARLYGGGAILIITAQKPDTPLTIEELQEGQKIEFKAIDMWELYNSIQNVVMGSAQLEDDIEYYDYYGKRVHKSRVLIVKGKKAPSFVRPRLRGWGMSEVERIIRSFNSYLKNQNLIFELLDEAKVDVYKIKGFNAALLTSGGTNAVASRVQSANMIKNFQSALTMDKEDDYEQKQISFAGLAEVLTQIRQGIAADVKMPMTKLFGISAAGFSSGEDDIENYNSMIESEMRAKVKGIVVKVLQVCCQIKFGYIPDDLKIVWKPLRILNAEQEETVKNHKFNRVQVAFATGLMSAQEAKGAFNKDSLLPVEVDDATDALDVSVTGKVVSEVGNVIAPRQQKQNSLIRRLWGA